MYAPVYTNAQQVVDCVASMLGVDPKECSAELKMVIGWNGEKLITSTDWHITYPDGCCILPPCISPQYQTFASLHVEQHILGSMLVSWTEPLPVKISFKNGDMKKIITNPKELISVTFHEKDRVILSDCEVTSERKKGVVEYHVFNDEDTIYGTFISGNLCMAR